MLLSPNHNRHEHIQTKSNLTVCNARQTCNRLQQFSLQKEKHVTLENSSLNSDLSSPPTTQASPEFPVQTRRFNCIGEDTK